jgi:hypothetical protein
MAVLAGLLSVPPRASVLSSARLFFAVVRVNQNCPNAHTLRPREPGLCARGGG